MVRSNLNRVLVHFLIQGDKQCITNIEKQFYISLTVVLFTRLNIDDLLPYKIIYTNYLSILLRSMSDTSYLFDKESSNLCSTLGQYCFLYLFIVISIWLLVIKETLLEHHTALVLVNFGPVVCDLFHILI